MSLWKREHKKNKKRRSQGEEGKTSSNGLNRYKYSTGDILNITIRLNWFRRRNPFLIFWGTVDSERREGEAISGYDCVICFGGR